MSAQLPQPQPQQQQPVVVYPNPVIGQLPPSTHDGSHSNGSFGTVLIVLAVIVVISGIACCLGRLCNRNKNKQQKPGKPNLQSRSSRPRGKEQNDHHDIEFGFDKGLPTGSRPGDKGDVRGHKPSAMNGHINGHIRGETNSVDHVRHGEPKVGP